MSDNNKFYAHSNEDSKYQILEDHLKNVAVLAQSFDINKGEDFFQVGLYHDLGKYQKSFQNRLLNNGPKVDHSTYGAKFVLENNPRNLNAILMAYCIAGHHSGLMDGGFPVNIDDSTLMARLKKKFNIDFNFMSELKNIKKIDQLVNFPKNEKDFLNYLQFRTRFMYSALVDADYLDTESFCKGNKRENNFDNLETLLKKLDNHYKYFKNDGIINIARTKLKDQAIKNISKKSNIYSLDLPTGAGKTLLSMRVALEKAICEGKDRIIYVIPYTSIIEQNAKVFKDIFGSKNVLEHHSNYEFSDDENENILKQCSENWDAPIIVTTNVQFFESIYHNKSSRMRKLHNMTNAVICFDEVHIIPLKLFKACVNAMLYLANYGKSILILMSATLLDYKKIDNRFDNIVDLTPNKKIYEAFSRCKVESLINETEDDIICKLDLTSSNLIVVNTKKTARRIFEKIDSEKKYYLTTLLTPKDRKNKIEEIRNRLLNGDNLVVVSTSLVEAGVDFDFKYCYREINGIDSIVQCMGRCNREGKRKDSVSYVF